MVFRRTARVKKSNFYKKSGKYGIIVLSISTIVRIDITKKIVNSEQ